MMGIVLQIGMVRCVVPTQEASVSLDESIAVGISHLVEVEVEDISAFQEDPMLGDQIVGG
jgi:hypothetical protein